MGVKLQFYCDVKGCYLTTLAPQHKEQWECPRWSPKSCGDWRCVLDKTSISFHPMTDGEFCARLDQQVIQRLEQQAYDLKHLPTGEYNIKYSEDRRTLFDQLAQIFAIASKGSEGKVDG